MPKALGPLTPAQVVERMRSAIGRKTAYLLGAGGRDPRLPHPADAQGRCDCSGAAAWGVGVDRYLPNGAIPHLPDGDWFETSNLWRDARSPFGFVDVVPLDEAEPGMLLVFPDGPGRQGHVGVISEVYRAAPLRVVHCSAGNFRATGDAFAETNCEVFFRNNAIAARVAWVKD